MSETKSLGMSERDARDLLFRAVGKLNEAYGAVRTINPAYASEFRALSREISAALYEDTFGEAMCS